MNYSYIANHIPRKDQYNRRPCLAMKPQWITIHNTGNPTSTAINERNWLTNPSNQRQASFHLVVDSSTAIECLPLNEVGWHAGDENGSGNRASIGIEICESGDYAKTLDNAADLVAKMLKERGWGIDRLRRHYDWSGKICPGLMYSSGKWTAWERFKLMVDKKLKGEEGMTAVEKEAFIQLQRTVELQSERIKELEKKTTMELPPKWALDACITAKEAGAIDTANGGSYDFYRMLTIMDRVGLFKVEKQ